MTRWSARARAWLAGQDGPVHAGLPVAELLAPIPLLCVLVLVLNDWTIKPSSAPRWLAGKLSDVAGLAVFPLIATAAGDLALSALAWLGLDVDATLRRWKLAAACGLTAVVFAAMKLSPDVAGLVEAALTALTRTSHVVPDPTDLVALPAIGLAWWQGRRAIARGSYGRLEVARRARARERGTSSVYADAVACGADPAVIAELEEAAQAWLDGVHDERAVARLTSALARARA